jgi:hypothetical protein
MDDRVSGNFNVEHEEPASPRRRRNLAIRYVGIILPFVLTYFVGIQAALSGGRAGLVCLALAAGIWAASSVALGVRRDWPGVGAVTFLYVVVDSLPWLFATGLFHAN